MSAQSLSGFDPFTSPEIVRVIDEVGKGLPEGEREDFRQTVKLRVWVAKKKPRHLKRMKAWLWVVSRGKLVDRHRRRSVRVDPHSDPSVELDRLAGPDRRELAGRDPLDLEKQLACFESEVKAGRISLRQARIVLYRVDGMTHAEIGKVMGLAEKTVRNEACRARKRAKKAWAAYLAGALFVAAAAFLWLLRRDPCVASGTPGGRSGPAPVHIAPSSQPHPGDRSQH